MAGFEYRYEFSVDDDILERYANHIPPSENSAMFPVEIRTNFMLKGRSSDSDERAIDAERFAVWRCGEARLRNDMAARLKQYQMPPSKIDRLIQEALLFGKDNSPSPAVQVPVPIAVDLNIYTLQQEEESMDEAVERAMRAEHLPPLYLCPVIDCANHKAEDEEVMRFLEVEEKAVVRVDDVEQVLAVIEACGVCGRNPMVGTAVSRLRCGHAFHNYCIARLLEEDDKCCSICRQLVYGQPPQPPPVDEHRIEDFCFDCSDSDGNDVYGFECSDSDDNDEEQKDDDDEQ